VIWITTREVLERGVDYVGRSPVEIATSVCPMDSLDNISWSADILFRISDYEIK